MNKLLLFLNPILLFLSDKLEQLLFYMHNPQFIRFYPSLINTQFITNNIPDELLKYPALPWYTYNSIIWIIHNISPKMNVFEFGSGMSTLFFLQNNVNVYSVEHDKAWYLKIKKIMKQKRITNGNIKLIQAEKKIKTPDDAEFISESYRDKNFVFKKYVLHINKYKDNFFDFIIIDGRARQACIKYAINKVKKGGYIILDNSELFKYTKAISYLNKYERKDFIGPGPYINTIWKTSIWKIN